MTVVSVRRQGGAAVITIPAEIVRMLRIDVGSELEVAVGDGAFTARPKARTQRRRYSLRELLRGATPEAVRQLSDQTAWAREGEPVGREI